MVLFLVYVAEECFCGLYVDFGVVGDGGGVNGAWPAKADEGDKVVCKVAVDGGVCF